MDSEETQEEENKIMAQLDIDGNVDDINEVDDSLFKVDQKLVDDIKEAHDTTLNSWNSILKDHKREFKKSPLWNFENFLDMKEGRLTLYTIEKI